MIVIRRLRIGESDLYRKIRLASLKEAPYAFSSTYESALQRSESSWREQSDHSAQGADRATFIVFSENEPVGVSAIYRSADSAEEGEILQVWIAPEYRGKNIGRQLLDELFSWAKANGLAGVKAKVMEGNVRALRFYQKNGFETAGTEDNNGIHEVVLIRKAE